VRRGLPVSTPATRRIEKAVPGVQKAEGCSLAGLRGRRHAAVEARPPGSSEAGMALDPRCWLDEATCPVIRGDDRLDVGTGEAVRPAERLELPSGTSGDGKDPGRN